MNTYEGRMPMRNRRKRGPEPTGTIAEENEGVVRDAEHTSREQVGNESASTEEETERPVRQPLLRRMTTREEIVQTDDDSAFMQLPVTAAKRSWTQYRRIVFILGCLMGVLLAWAFRSPDLQLEGLLDAVDMADFFDDIRAALPSALPIGIMQEAKEIQKHTRESVGTGAFSIGEQMFRDGLTANYPVVMVFPRQPDVTYQKGAGRHLDRSRKLVHDKLLVPQIFISVLTL
jgi:hypothetical protein